MKVEKILHSIFDDLDIMRIVGKEISNRIILFRIRIS